MMDYSCAKFGLILVSAIHHVRDSLPDDAAKTVAVSIVTTRLDYCNSLFFGMSTRNFARLQRVQNTLARVLLRKRKFDHITPSLMKLHWLPIQQRVHLNLLYLHTRPSIQKNQTTF